MKGAALQMQQASAFGGGHSTAMTLTSFFPATPLPVADPDKHTTDPIRV
jgi:hypothetical protein